MHNHSSRGERATLYLTFPGESRHYSGRRSIVEVYMLCVSKGLPSSYMHGAMSGHRWLSWLAVVRGRRRYIRPSFPVRGAGGYRQKLRRSVRLTVALYIHKRKSQLNKISTSPASTSNNEKKYREALWGRGRMSTLHLNNQHPEPRDPHHSYAWLLPSAPSCLPLPYTYLSAYTTQLKPKRGIPPSRTREKPSLVGFFWPIYSKIGCVLPLYLARPRPMPLVVLG